MPPSLCVVRGSVNVDEYFHVREIVKPGETISSSGHERRVGGKGANQAVAIARAGGDVGFYAYLGKDAVWIKEKMREWGVDVEKVDILEDEMTGRAIIQVDRNGENSIILFPGANHHQGERPFPDGMTHLVLQNEIHMESTLDALRSVDKNQVVVVMNPSPLPSEQVIVAFPWRTLSWLIVNEGEAAVLYQALVSESAKPLPEAFLTLLAKLPELRDVNVVCTLGARGVLALIRNGESVVNVPALRGVNVKDTTGAGDCFMGYFVSGLMRMGKEVGEEELKEVLKKCVCAAGMSVEKSGTIDSIPTNEEVQMRMRSGT